MLDGRRSDVVSVGVVLCSTEWCFCGGVLAVVFLWWCGGVFVVVFSYCLCGAVFVVVFLWLCLWW